MPHSWFLTMERSCSILIPTWWPFGLSYQIRLSFFFVWHWQEDSTLLNTKYPRLKYSGTDHFTMNTHLSLLVTLTWLRIIDNSPWKTFDNLDLSLVTSRRDHLWKILTIWLAICASYLHENNITSKYRNTFVTVTSDRKEGKSGLRLANIAYGSHTIGHSAGPLVLTKVYRQVTSVLRHGKQWARVMCYTVFCPLRVPPQIRAPPIVWSKSILLKMIKIDKVSLIIVRFSTQNHHWKPSFWSV